MLISHLLKYMVSSHCKLHILASQELWRDLSLSSAWPLSPDLPRMCLGTAIQNNPISMFFEYWFSTTISKLCGNPVGLLITSSSLLLNPRRMVETDSHMEHTTRDIVLLTSLSGTVIPGSGTGFKITHQFTSLEMVPHAGIQSRKMPVRGPVPFPVQWLLTSFPFHLLESLSGWAAYGCWCSLCWVPLQAPFFFSYHGGLNDIFPPNIL